MIQVTVTPHPDFPNDTHVVKVKSIVLLPAERELQVHTISEIQDEEGVVKHRVERKYEALIASDETFVNAQGQLVEGPADGVTVFPEYTALEAQLMPMLLPYITGGILQADALGRYN